MGHALRGTMAQIQSFRELEVWQLSMDLVDEVIKARQSMPRVEFDLRRQITRAAVSIPSNIAEGWRRKRKRSAYQNHVSIAMGSHGELDTQLEVCFRNDFLRRDDWKNLGTLLMRVRLMLDRLHDSLD
jgi:four helix bundle protein